MEGLLLASAISLGFGYRSDGVLENLRLWGRCRCHHCKPLLLLLQWKEVLKGRGEDDGNTKLVTGRARGRGRWVGESDGFGRMMGWLMVMGLDDSGFGPAALKATAVSSVHFRDRSHDTYAKFYFPSISGTKICSTACESLLVRRSIDPILRSLLQVQPAGPMSQMSKF
jgi:hypothetical protein